MAEKNTPERPWKKDETTPNIDFWSRTLGNFEAKFWIKGRKIEDGYTWEVWDGWRREDCGTAPTRDSAMAFADKVIQELHDARQAHRLGWDRNEAIRDATERERPYDKRLLWSKMSTTPTTHLGGYEGHLLCVKEDFWEFEIRNMGDAAGPGPVIGYGHEDSLVAAVAAVEDRLAKLKAAADERRRMEEDRMKAAAEEAARKKAEADLSAHTTHVSVGGKNVLSVTWKDVIHPTVPRVYGESNEAGRGMKAEIYLDTDTNRWVWAVGRQGAVASSGYSSALGTAKTDATESIWELIEGENERARKQEELRAAVAKAEAEKAEADKKAEVAKRMVEEADELRAVLKHFDDQTVAYGRQVRLTRKTDGATIKCDRIEDGPDKGWWTYVVRSGDSMREHRGQAPSRMEAQLGAAWLIHEWARLDAEGLKKDVKIHFEDADKKAAAAKHHAPVTTEDVRKTAGMAPAVAETLGIHVLANGNLLFDPLFVAQSAIDSIALGLKLKARLEWLMNKIEEVYRRAPECAEGSGYDCDYSDCTECRLDELLEDQEQWAKTTGLAGSDR